jgi:methylated-DNA-protein-cysteine methyltransferase-like protein
MKARYTHAYLRVWEVVCRIPRGRVATYGAIAALCGRRGQARFIGYALHHLPHGSEIPWHRVVNARGMVSLGGAAGAKQRKLLESEGLVFVEGRIDPNVFGWNGFRRRPKGP